MGFGVLVGGLGLGLKAGCCCGVIVCWGVLEEKRKESGTTGHDEGEGFVFVN